MKLPTCCLRRAAALQHFSRQVSTWSPLASTFNTKPSKKLSLDFRKYGHGLFGIPEMTEFSGFYLLQEKVKDEVDSLVKEATGPKRNRKMVQVFDQLSDSLCRVADMADFTRVAHPDQKFSAAAEEVCMNLSALVETLNTNVELYSALKNTLLSGDSVPVDELDQRVAQLFIFDFEQSGIHLDDKKRERFVKLNESILMTGTYFVQGTQNSVSIAKESIPEHIRDCFSTQGDSVLVNGMMSEHHSDIVREAAYRLYLYPNKGQLDLLETVLHARWELANLVGFPTYAHRALNGTTAQNPENVSNFLGSLSEKIWKRADEDYKQMADLKRQSGAQCQDIKPWDPPYFTAFARHLKCEYQASELSPFFSLGCCMEGLNNLFQRLYDVTLEMEEVADGEVWSHDVHKLAVKHRTEGLLGYIYCDFFEKSGKPNQDCHFTIQGGRQKEDGSYQHPIVVLQLNFPQPTSRVPSLLTPGMMENLFHEFGHAMHSMLGRTKYQHVTGTRCPTDFAEVPSVLMEFFAWDPRIISSYARHYKTEEPLNPGTIQKLCESKKLFLASETQGQVYNSMMDQVYHGHFPEGTSTMSLLEEVQNKYYGIPYIDKTAWHMRFGHLIGYGAKYYSYLMSRAVASRIWHKCFKDDPFNREMGERYRNRMLAHGGGKHPTELIQDMLDESVSMDKLVQSLVDEID